MDFEDSAEEAAFRRRARTWIAENAPMELKRELEQTPFGQLGLKSIDSLKAAKDWQRKKAKGGWACLSWPKEYGGAGASPIETLIWQQEEGVFKPLGMPFIVGLGVCGPAILVWGTPEQKAELLPPMIFGDEIWCQLFSEPGAGSDLAGIRTRAQRSGDGWIINGSKIWSSGARDSQKGLLIARTDADLPKHAGLTMFCIDTDTPGVDIRPIKQINGHSHFNEVFFTDAWIPDSQRLGPVGAGWKVTLTALMNERASVGAEMQTGFEELLPFVTRNCRSGCGLADTGLISRLASIAVRDNGLKFTNYRVMTAISETGDPGPENSVMKLVAGATSQEVAMLGMDLQGLAGAAMGGDVNEDGELFQMMLLRSAGRRIEGGTDEIMRGIIADRVLNLPPDIRVDKNISFNLIPHS
ncbi:acyl-CoA dehydrogenase family protein (plasmid) [Sphingobium sp. SJ10-10]|uniref:acyl-CoA dehydrogenase family protein n=1 Tax=Sphingobium sp. SJ10-10 TaxID=3114999 RepID=UPI002E198011|nr:acyl-CoA dehydrogenase family protein [Sphingobium sp. SJ10-10]